MPLLATAPPIYEEGSKRYTEHYKKMCFKKRYYVSEVEAIQAAVEQPRLRFRAYPCDYCGGWHLTTQEPNITPKTINKLKKKKCKRGHVYLTFAQAQQAASNGRGKPITCDLCGLYHVVR